MSRKPKQKTWDALLGESSDYTFIQEHVYLKREGSPETCCWCSDKSTRKTNCWIDGEHCIDRHVCEKHWNELYGMYLNHKFVRFGYNRMGIK